MKKFMVEFQLKPENEKKVMELFGVNGPNRSPGVTFRDAWIGTRSEMIFVLCESAEERLVEEASHAWKQFGDCKIHQVINHEQY
jgi:hypothetical protein